MTIYLISRTEQIARGCAGILRGLNAVLQFRRDKTGHDCARMADFEVISAVTAIEVIARGPGIRDAARLNREHGRGNWRKLKGITLVRLANGRVRKFSRVRIAVPHKAEAWEPKGVR